MLLSIRYFEIIGEVIEKEITYICSRTGKSKTKINKEIVDYCKTMHDEWYKPQPNIPYDNSICRIAYLYAHVGVNSNLIGYIFRNDDELSNYIIDTNSKKGIVNICAFGGGPGSELLGFTKPIVNMRYEKPIHLKFTLTDIVSDWFSSWRGLESSIESRLIDKYGVNRTKWPIITQGYSNPVNVTNPSCFDHTQGAFENDLYIMNYLLSEISNDFEKFVQFLEEVNKTAPLGAKYLFVDLKLPKEKTKVEKIAHALNLDLSKIRDTSRNMDRDEDKTDLGNIYIELSAIDRKPRIKWDSFWRIGTKN